MITSPKLTALGILLLCACCAVAPDYVQERCEHASILLEAGQVEEARDALEDASAHAETSRQRAVTQALMVESYIADGDLRRARECADELAEDETGQFVTWATMSVLSLLAGDLDKAERDLRIARRVSDAREVSWVIDAERLVKAFRLFSAGMLDDALTELDKISHDGLEPSATYLRHRIRTLQGDLDDRQARARRRGIEDGARDLFCGADVDPRQLAALQRNLPRMERAAGGPIDLSISGHSSGKPCWGGPTPSLGLFPATAFAAGRGLPLSIHEAF